MKNDKSTWKDSDASVETVDKRMGLMVMWRGKLVALWQMSDRPCSFTYRATCHCCSFCCRVTCDWSQSQVVGVRLMLRDIDQS